MKLLLHPDKIQCWQKIRKWFSTPSTIRVWRLLSKISGLF